MIDFSIKMAESVFLIHTLYPDTEIMCRQYITSEPFDAEITVTEADILSESRQVRDEAVLNGTPVPRYALGYLETIAVYRKIATWFSYRNAAVFHGVLLEKGGYGYLFTAKSGTGKSTHAANWKKLYPDCRIINGDKPIIKISDNGIIGFGTPWAGKESWQINDFVPIKAIIVLSRSEANHIEPISFKDALPILLSQTYRAKDGMGIQRALLTVGAMKNKVAFFALGCNMDADSARIAYEGMQ